MLMNTALEARLGAGDLLFNFSPSNLELLLNVRY